MATSNINITGTYTEIVGDVLSNSSFTTILYVFSEVKPANTVIGNKLTHNSEIDLREYRPLKMYAKSVNGMSIKATINTGLPLTGSTGGGSSGSDRELVVTTYTCKTAFTGASVGDIITQTQVVDVTATPSTVNVLWRNQTTNTDLATAPDGSKLSLVGTGSALTDLQLRAAPINVNIQNTEVEVKNNARNPLNVSLTNSSVTTTVTNEVEVKNASGTPLDVNITNESINVNVSEVEITNDVGSPIPVSITNIPEVEIKNDSGNPISVSHNGLTDTQLRAAPVTINGTYDRWRDSFEYDDGTLWTKSIDANDYYSLQGNAQGAGWGQLSKSALTNNTASKLISKNKFTLPVRLGYGTSISQRINGEFYTVDMIKVDPTTGDEVITDGEVNNHLSKTILINTLSVTSNIAKVYFSSDHNFIYDDLVVIYGAVDTRVNLISRVTQVINKRCIQVGLTIANATYTVGASCYISMVNLSSGVSDVAGMCYYDTTVSNALYYHRAQSSAPLLSAQSSFGGSLTDALIPSSQSFAYNLQPRFASEIIAGIDVLRFGANPIDNIGTGAYYKRTQIIPGVNNKYAMRMKAVTLPNKAVPLEILNATKSGTTTATVTTVNPHGLSTGAYVRMYGVRDQVNWANLITETVITVTGANTFTLVWGVAVTATIYGGFAIAVNGTNSVTGAANLAVYGTTWAAGRLYVGTNTTPALAIGDTVRLVGVKDTTGAYRANTTGRFRVAGLTPNILQTSIIAGATTTLSSPTVTMTDTSAMVIGGIVTGTNIPASTTISARTVNTNITLSANATAAGSTWLNLTGMVLEPLDFIAPADDQQITYISAGGIIKETDFRFSFVRCLDYTRTPVEITGGHTTSDQQLAVPANIVNNISAQVLGAVATGVAISGNPIATAGRSLANVTRNILTDDAGGVTGPGEVIYNGWAFTAASATPVDGTNSRTLQAPMGRDCDIYLGISVLGTSPTIQVEGSWDNVNFSVIPMQRHDLLAVTNQYVQQANWVPVANAIYKGKTYGYPFVRIHQTGGIAFTTISAVRFVPMTIVPGETTSAFSLSAVSTTEAVGTSAGALQAGGVRTLAVPVKGASKVTLILDALTYATAIPTSSSLVVEGSLDNTNWTPLSLQPIQGGAPVTSITGLGALNQWFSGVWESDVSAYSYVRVRRSATVTGTSTNIYYHGALKITPVSTGVNANNFSSTYRPTVAGVSATTVNYVLAALEAGANETVRLKKLTIWNPGSFTTAQLSFLEIVRTTAASTGGTVRVPNPSGVNDGAFSGIFKFGNPTITAGATLWTGSFYTPTTLSNVAPLVIDFTNGNTTKGIEIPPGVTNGIALLHNTGAAGGANLAYTLEFTEE